MWLQYNEANMAIPIDIVRGLHLAINCLVANVRVIHMARLFLIS